MKIRSIEVFKRDLALTKPYTIAYKTTSSVESAFMILQLENGIKGIGAANPAVEVVGESTDDVISICTKEHCDKFIGRDIRHFRKIIQEVRDAFPKNPGVQAVWDIALHDAFCNFLGIPIVDLYGRCHDALPTSVTIGIMNVSDTLKEALEYKKQGFKVLKVKTGESVEEDIERMIKIKEEHPNLIIRVDANQGYTGDELRRFINGTEKADVELIEQPLPVGKENDLLGLEYKMRDILTADESLKNATSAVQLASDPKPYGIYNIKLMKCGGIYGALEIATIAKASGIDLFWGCNDESIVGITAALHTAYACPQTRYIDLDGSLDLAEDLVSGGFVIRDGLMYLKGSQGLGCVMN